MKFLFRIFIAILSGISTYFAFPTYLFLVDRVLGRSVFSPLFSLFPHGLILIFTPCVVIPILVFTSLRHRDVGKIRMSRTIQTIITFIASFPVVVLFVEISPLNPLNFLTTLIYLNFFFFSMIVLSSLYYLLRTALTVKRREEAALPP